MKPIVVFDMDYTLCEGYLQAAYLLCVPPKERQEMIQKGVDGVMPWGQIMSYALKKYPPTAQLIQAYLKSIPPVHNISILLNFLKQSCEIAIVSGGNEYLIKRYMEINNLPYDYVYGNKSEQIGNTYTYEVILQQCTIPLCKPYACKAFLLKTIMQSHERVFYVGDGFNDLCCMSLVKNNYLRENKYLHCKIQNDKTLMQYFKGEPKIWKDGNQLIQLLAIDLK